MSLIALGSATASAVARSAQFNQARQVGDPFSSFLRAAVGSVDEPDPSPTDHQCVEATEPAAALQQHAEASLESFRRTLSQLFKQSGVDTSQKITLQSDGRGGMQLAGAHPNAAEIERLLADHPELATQFQQLAEEFEHLRQLGQPTESVQPLLRPSFSLMIENDAASVAFE